jgi:hypothetical protein
MLFSCVAMTDIFVFLEIGNYLYFVRAEKERGRTNNSEESYTLWGERVRREEGREGGTREQVPCMEG